jgi:hypothetical protein
MPKRPIKQPGHSWAVYHIKDGAAVGLSAHATARKSPSVKSFSLGLEDSGGYLRVR